jgi:phosphatidate phosphatase APP1
MHGFAVLEDWFVRLRARFVVATGHVPTVIPFRGLGSTSRVRILARVLYVHPDPTTRKARKVVRGWRAFRSVPVAHYPVRVRIDGHRTTLTADRGGVVDTTIDLSLTPGWHTVEMRAKKGTGWTSSEVFIVDPSTTRGVVCDVDDTVMITYLPRLLLAAWNTFVLDENARMSVPGMPELMGQLAKGYPNLPTVYLSTGPWNVAPTLERFLTRHRFPKGPFLLTDWGATPDRAFRSGREHKVGSLERLANDFPNIEWVLIGDDGQHDETIYGDFSRSHPGKVRAVAIRQLSTPEAVLAGAPSMHPSPSSETVWVTGHTGTEIANALKREGVL